MTVPGLMSSLICGDLNGTSPLVFTFHTFEIPSWTMGYFFLKGFLYTLTTVVIGSSSHCSVIIVHVWVYVIIKTLFIRVGLMVETKVSLQDCSCHLTSRSPL
jgi:hypothetical protein